MKKGNSMNTKAKIKKLDKYLRDKSGVTADDFVATYCPVLAEHAYATRDGSINEMEKTLCHVVGMLIYYKRFAEIVGFGGDEFDPRDFVNEFEGAQEEADAKKAETCKNLLSKLLDDR